MSGTSLGLIMAAACLGVLAWLFHHYLVRIHNARAWLSRGAVLVDVDTAAEFVEHHPRVAVSIPLEDLARRVADVGAKDGAIVVFAHSWRRGAQAVHALRGLGYSAVMNAAGLHTKERLAATARLRADSQHPRLIELSRASDSDPGPAGDGARLTDPSNRVTRQP